MRCWRASARTAADPLCRPDDPRRRRSGLAGHAGGAPSARSCPSSACQTWARPSTSSTSATSQSHCTPSLRAPAPNSVCSPRPSRRSILRDTGRAAHRPGSRSAASARADLGRYHGEYSVDTFIHTKPVLDKPLAPDTWRLAYLSPHPVQTKHPALSTVVYGTVSVRSWRRVLMTITVMSRASSATLAATRYARANPDATA